MTGVFECFEYGDRRDTRDLMLCRSAAEENQYPSHAGQITVVSAID
jgi:hypothetical protein